MVKILRVCSIPRINQYQCRRLLLSVLLVAGLCLSWTLPARADDYDCGAYGMGTYQGNVCAATAEELTNTGQPLWHFIVPAVLILIGVVWLLRTRRTMNASSTDNPRQ